MVQRTACNRHAVPCTTYCALIFSLLSLVLVGCLKSTYPDNYVKESILKILRTEYNIPMAQVVITGKTIHLYLPVERLFTADLDDTKVTYVEIFQVPVKNIFIVGVARIFSAPQDSYWELLARIYHAPALRWFKLNWVHTKLEKKKIEKIQDAIGLHPEVQDEIGQMLFAVARVARSTDLKLDFYSAQVTDMRSGHEFILQGYLQDMNRLQLMDISMGEYHRRMLKDTHLNDRALVHFPVRNFFADLNQKTRDEVKKKFFSKVESNDWMERFHFQDKLGTLFPVSQMTWEIQDVRSFLSPAGGRALVYVQAEMIPRDVKKAPAEPIVEKYIFETQIRGKSVQVIRIIPFNLLSEMLASSPEFKIDEMTLRENIKTWRSEFDPKEILLEDFLARQMMTRLYEDIYQDERISNTFTDLHFEIRFRPEPVREFVFDVRATLKDANAHLSGKPLLGHEDMVYLESKLVGQAASTLHSYRFQDFQGVSVELPEEGERYSASAADLELFYRKKKSLNQILHADVDPIASVA